MRKFYWDTDGLAAEGSLIAQNTSSDFRGLRKTSSAEEGDEENRILLKTAL